MGKYDLYQERFATSESLNKAKYDALVNAFDLAYDVTSRTVRNPKDGMGDFKEFSSIWNNYRAGKLFDHVRIYKTIDGSIIGVSQPYFDTNHLLEILASDISFVAHCLKYNYRIDIYEDNRYNWYNSGTTPIVFTYNPWVLSEVDINSKDKQVLNVYITDAENNKRVVHLGLHEE